MNIIETYENLPKVAKIILQIFLGSLIGGIYRIIRYFENKNIVTLVAGILCFVGLGVVFWIIDLVTEVTKNRITFLAD